MNRNLMGKAQVYGTMQKVLFNYGIYILLGAVILLLCVVNPSFRTMTNISNVLIQISDHALLGIGMTFIIMTGGMDVSIGATMVLSSSVYVIVTQKLGCAEPVGLVAMLAVGVLIGTLNGVGVAYLNMPAFLVTLSTQCIGRGFSLVLTGGVSYRNLGESFRLMGKSSFLGLHMLIWLVIVAYIIGFLLLHRTVFGREIMAVGGNLKAARVSGINDRRTILMAYIIMGVISSMAGFMTAARLGSHFASMGDGIEFMVIAGVVIGGTSLSGGSGSMIGTIAGAALIGIINNALNLFGVNTEWQNVAKGLVIFLAVMFDAVKNRSINKD